MSDFRAMVPPDMWHHLSSGLSTGHSPAGAAWRAASWCRRTAAGHLMRVERYRGQWGHPDRERRMGAAYGYARAWLDMADRYERLAHDLAPQKGAAPGER